MDDTTAGASNAPPARSRWGWRLWNWPVWRPSWNFVADLARLARGQWRPIAGVAAVFAAGGAWVLLIGNPFERQTLGTILVDTPEIYTRERLVNDRFIQEAWLARQLEPKDGVHASESVITLAREIVVELRKSPAKAQQDADKSGTDPNKAPREQSDKSGATTSTGAAMPRQSTRQKLMEEIDYRELVRNLTIENQLDDRHDLKGNSLYKLKFDAAVLPGANTQASARITVRLLGPKIAPTGPAVPIKSLSELGSKEDQQAWRDMYERWLTSLGSRLNQAHNELKLGFHKNDFAYNDYARFIEFLAKNLRVSAGSVASCPRRMLDYTKNNQLPLNANEHKDRKRCINEIINATIAGEVITPPNASQSPLTRSRSDEQYVDLAELAKLYRRRATPEERSAQVTAMLDYWLDAFFASRAIRLILHMEVPENAFTSTDSYTVPPALNNLPRLAFFQALRREVDGKIREDGVFSVVPKKFSAVAIDPANAKEETLRRLAKETAFPKVGLKDFKPVSFAPKPFLILESQVGAMEGVTLVRGDFEEIADGLGVYRVNVEPGLLNFVNLARQQNVAFSYSVTPKETADTVAATRSLRSRVDGGAQTERDSVALTGSRDVHSQAVQRRPVVVGFAGIAPRERGAEFGWLIAPQQSDEDGQALAYKQAPTQYSLSALVSLPAWWPSIRLQVTTSWVGKDGKTLLETVTAPETEVELPADFEALEGYILGIRQSGPELMDERSDPMLLTACEPGSILITGKRLWRSTKVTLGHQLADSIYVLPNMKGIIARFNKIENQVNIEEEHRFRVEKGQNIPRQVARNVRVWTSQGLLILPSPAQIGIPEGVPINRCPSESHAPGAQSGAGR